MKKSILSIWFLLVSSWAFYPKVKMGSFWKGVRK